MVDSKIRPIWKLIGEFMEPYQNIQHQLTVVIDSQQGEMQVKANEEH